MWRIWLMAWWPCLAFRLLDGDYPHFTYYNMSMTFLFIFYIAALILLFIFCIVAMIIFILSYITVIIRYSPLTLLAILDPNAVWLSSWLHLHLSRSLLLSRYFWWIVVKEDENTDMKTFRYRLGKARKILQEMLTAVNTFLKDKSFTYFEEVKADFHMFKSQRVFNLVSAKVNFFFLQFAQTNIILFQVVEFAEFHFQLRFLCTLLSSKQVTQKYNWELICKWGWCHKTKGFDDKDKFRKIESRVGR